MSCGGDGGAGRGDTRRIGVTHGYVIGRPVVMVLMVVVCDLQKARISGALMNCLRQLSSWQSFGGSVDVGLALVDEDDAEVSTEELAP